MKKGSIIFNILSTQKGGDRMKKQKRMLNMSLRTFPWIILLFAILVNPCIGAEDPAKFPSKPITMIIPWPAGGTTDTAIRRLCDLGDCQVFS
jgi:hypothetical protein